MTPDSSPEPQTETHKARCLCGDVIFEATGPAKYTEFCHCKWCQQVSGAAFLPLAVFDKDKVKVTGELSQYHSSPECSRGFCANCGSTMSFHSPRHFDIALGVMDDPEPFKGDMHIWTKSKISHITVEDDLPQHTESPE